MAAAAPRELQDEFALRVQANDKLREMLDVDQFLGRLNISNSNVRQLAKLHNPAQAPMHEKIVQDIVGATRDLFLVPAEDVEAVMRKILMCADDAVDWERQQRQAEAPAAGSGSRNDNASAGLEHRLARLKFAGSCTTDDVFAMVLRDGFPKRKDHQSPCCVVGEFSVRRRLAVPYHNLPAATDGGLVQFVEHSSVNQVRMSLVEALTVFEKGTTDFKIKFPIVTGVSGSGKSRLAHHLLYETALGGILHAAITVSPRDNDPDMFGKQGSFSARLQHFRDTKMSEDDIRDWCRNQADHFLVCFVLRSASSSLIEFQPCGDGAPKVTFGQVLHAWADHAQQQEQKEVINFVVHVDEFQSNRDLACGLIRAIRNADRVGKQSQPPFRVVPLLTGLASRETLVALREQKYDVSDLEQSQITLGYLPVYTSVDCQPGPSWELFCNACNIHCDLQLKVKDAQANMLVRYLVEDTGGWPQALVQAGSALRQLTLGTHLDLNRSVVEKVEAFVVGDALPQLYQPDQLLQCLGIGDDGVAKLFCLAATPFLVHENEPINGSKVQDLMENGMVVITHHEDFPQHYHRITMSSLLLQLISAQWKPPAQPAQPSCFWAPLPPASLLKTVRDYSSLVQEGVHIWSFATSFNALASLCKPEPRRLTLAQLRAGATFLGARHDDLEFLVTRAEENKLSLGVTVATDMVLHDLASLVSDEVPFFKAGLFRTGFKAFDGWVKLRDTSGNTVLVLTQTKGKQSGEAVGQSGGDRGVNPALIVEWLGHMQELVKQARDADDDGWRHVRVVFELMTAQRFSETNQNNKTAESNIDSLRRQTEYFEESIVFIHRDLLRDTAGAVFGGMVARYKKGQTTTFV